MNVKHWHCRDSYYLSSVISNMFLFITSGVLSLDWSMQFKYEVSQYFTYSFEQISNAWLHLFTYVRQFLSSKTHWYVKYSFNAKWISFNLSSISIHFLISIFQFAKWMSVDLIGWKVFSQYVLWDWTHNVLPC